jgi:ketosteroid isomerase-like protein
MSRENVEATKESIAAYNRRDFDAALALYDPEVEWVFPPSMGAETCHGPEEVRHFWRGLEGTLEDFRLEPQEFIDAGDCVAVRLRFHGRGKASGIEVDEEMYHLAITFRAGRIIRMEYVVEWEEALEAAGLTDQGP